MTLNRTRDTLSLVDDIEKGFARGDELKTRRREPYVLLTPVQALTQALANWGIDVEGAGGGAVDLIKELESLGYELKPR